jgi:hypothetical protein
MRHFDPARANATALRLRQNVRLLMAGKAPLAPKPLIERETMKLPGDIVIFPDRVEVIAQNQSAHKRLGDG